MSKIVRTAAAAAASLIIGVTMAAVPVDAHAVQSHRVRDCHFNKRFWWGERFDVDRVPARGGICTTGLPGMAARVLGVYRAPVVERSYRVLG